MQCAVALDENTKCPRWDLAMKQWFPDPAVRSYVQRVAGSALVGAQRDHAFIIHFGDGRNGKGTFIRGLQNVLGEYATVIHLSLLQKTQHKQHDAVKAALFRSRLAVGSETEKRIPLDEAQVKNLTGGDRITACRKYENPWEFTPTHSLWLQTNNLPKISGTDTGIWSRIRVVKWETTFSPEDQVKDLDETLAKEAPGILNWMLEGCLSWQKEGLNEPEAVTRETMAYRDREDVVKLSMSDVGLALDPSLKIRSKELQALLKEWAEEAGIPAPVRQLKSVMENAGCTDKKPRIDGERVKILIGIGLRKSEEDEQYELDEREGVQQQ